MTKVTDVNLLWPELRSVGRHYVTLIGRVWKIGKRTPVAVWTGV